MGNNRMVVNKNGTTEQITHYYPYGGVIGDISTNENVQKYKFEGKELDRTFGLDYYDIHARQYFAMMPSWDRIDSKAEDYCPISPYAYCGGDPVNKIDKNGESISVLLARNGAYGLGHMALLIQDDKGKWRYYSKEGQDRESKKGTTPYETVKEFLTSDNPEKYGRDRYTDFYIIPTDNNKDAEGKTPDERAKEAAIQEIEKEYNPATANCSDVVKSALSAAGKPDGTAGGNAVENSIPNLLFPRIVIQNETQNNLKSIWETIKDLFSK
jgi:RHS repeat-associated protein